MPSRRTMLSRLVAAPALSSARAPRMSSSPPSSSATVSPSTAPIRSPGSARGRPSPAGPPRSATGAGRADPSPALLTGRPSQPIRRSTYRAWAALVRSPHRADISRRLCPGYGRSMTTLSTSAPICARGVVGGIARVIAAGAANWPDMVGQGSRIRVHGAGCYSSPWHPPHSQMQGVGTPCILNCPSFRTSAPALSRALFLHKQHR